MPAPPSASEDGVVARLRAAGCVFAEDEARLLVAAAAGPEELAGLVERRVSGLPLEHLLGWAEFCARRIAVAPGVFVPRRRTEVLVRAAAERARPGGVVVDLCCGSGAVGAAIAWSVPGVELYAADIDPAAVACARTNVAAVGGRVFVGDLDEPLPEALRGRVAVLVANVPYVPTDDIARMPPEAREHEPRVALDGGPDGLDVARRVIAAAPGWLVPGGSLLFETSAEQAPSAVRLVAAGGLTPHVVTDDDVGATVVVGTRG